MILHLVIQICGAFKERTSSQRNAHVVPEAGYTHNEIKISNQFLDGIKQERGINSLHKKVKTFPLVYILGYRISSFPIIGREFGDRYKGKSS